MAAKVKQTSAICHRIVWLQQINIQTKCRFMSSNMKVSDGIITLQRIQRSNYTARNTP